MADRFGRRAELAGLICESFAFQVAAPDFAVAVVKGLSHLAPHAHVLHLKFEDFSRDPQAVNAMNDDPLIAHETQPTKTVAELARADDRLEREFPLITLPVLILHGTADKVTRPGGSQLFYDTAGSTESAALRQAGQRSPRPNRQSGMDARDHGDDFRAPQDFSLAWRSARARRVLSAGRLDRRHPGLRTFGLPRKLLAEIFSTWPSAGFHKRLVQLSLKRLRTHPWSPLPMFRL